MTVDEAIAIFSSCSPGEKAEFLAGLMHDLTVLAREGYEVGGDGLADPKRARRVNEIQHQVSAFLWALLRGDPRRYSDDALVRIILEGHGDDRLARQLGESFVRLAGRHTTVA